MAIYEPWTMTDIKSSLIELAKHYAENSNRDNFVQIMATANDLGRQEMFNLICLGVDLDNADQKGATAKLPVTERIAYRNFSYFQHRRLGGGMMLKYDNSKTFDYVLNAVKSMGFVDTTSTTDFCPSISRDLPGGSKQQVFIDYANRELREDPIGKLFSVYHTDKNGYEKPGYDFLVDNADELIKALEQGAE